MSTNARARSVLPAPGSSLIVVAIAACGSPTAGDKPAPDVGLSSVCPTIVVEQGLDVELDAGDGRGAYRIEVSTGGQRAVLELELDEPGAGPRAAGLRCGGDSSPWLLGCSATTATVRAVIRPASEPSLPAMLHVENLDGSGGPGELTVTVSRGSRSATRTLTPRYQDSWPHGRSCGLIRTARERITAA